VPRRVRDEVLKGLIRRRLADPLEHRRPRLARAVAQQAVDILSQRHMLRAMAEAVLELIHPARQASQQCGRVLIEHCAAAYVKRKICTMPSKVITRTFTKQFNDLTKSYLEWVATLRRRLLTTCLGDSRDLRGWREGPFRARR